MRCGVTKKKNKVVYACTYSHKYVLYKFLKIEKKFAFKI